MEEYRRGLDLGLGFISLQTCWNEVALMTTNKDVKGCVLSTDVLCDNMVAHQFGEFGKCCEFDDATTILDN